MRAEVPNEISAPASGIDIRLSEKVLTLRHKDLKAGFWTAGSFGAQLKFYPSAEVMQQEVIHNLVLIRNVSNAFHRGKVAAWFSRITKVRCGLGRRGGARQRPDKAAWHVQHHWSSRGNSAGNWWAGFR